METFEKDLKSKARAKIPPLQNVSLLEDFSCTLISRMNHFN